MALTKIGKEGITGIDNSSDATAITIDSSENVGIGITDPADKLQVANTSGSVSIALEANTTGTSSIKLGDTASTSAGEVIYDNSNNSMAFHTSGSERMRIDSSGNVAIGHTSPAGILDARASATARVYINASGELIIGSESGGDLLQLVDYGASSSTNANPYMEFIYSTSLGGSETRLGYVGYGSVSNNDFLINNETSNGSIRLYTVSSERVRVDSDGLKFNGDTAANNALSDYEQGSWTVDVQDSSGNSATSIDGNGRYIRIGNLVTVNGRFSNMDLTGLTTGNDLRIYGLPFTSSGFGGSSLFWMGAAPRMENISWQTADSTQISMSLGEGVTYLRFMESRNGTSDDFLTVSQFTTSSDCWFSITYSTTTF